MHPKFQIRGILNSSKFEGTGQWSLVARCCCEQHVAALACPQGHGPPYRPSSTPRRVHTTRSGVLAPTCSKGVQGLHGTPPAFSTALTHLPTGPLCRGCHRVSAPQGPSLLCPPGPPSCRACASRLPGPGWKQGDRLALGPASSPTLTVLSSVSALLVRRSCGLIQGKHNGIPLVFLPFHGPRHSGPHLDPH